MKPVTAAAATGKANPTYYAMLFAISLVHLFNDTIQAVIPAIYPLLEKDMDLSYFQIGLIGLAINLTASVMQPLVGMYSDSKPSPFLLPTGMASTFVGVLGLSLASNYAVVLLSVVFIGIGSAVFHPEASKVAYLAAGHRRGLAQSIYQVGGNAGQALAPLIAILIFAPFGQIGAIWFTLVAGSAIAVQLWIAKWYRVALASRTAGKARRTGTSAMGPDDKRIRMIRISMLLLIVFVFARSWYHAAISSYYQFYLMKHLGMSYEWAQAYIFAFLAAGAAGTFFGGPLADRFGRKRVILFSMLGSAPLSIALPFADPVLAFVLCLLVGFVILSSFSVMVVYAQELLPGKVGTVSGLIIGLAFGLGALGSLALGGLSDWWGIDTIMYIAGFLPIFGLIAIFLPSDETLRSWNEEE